MYREVKEEEALRAYMDGKKVLCLNEEDNVNFTLGYYFNGLRFLIDEETAEAPKEKIKEQAIKKGHSRKKLDIDVPKMQALKKAGWTDAKIADEFGISQSSVWRYLHMEKGEEDESVPNE